MSFASKLLSNLRNKKSKQDHCLPNKKWRRRGMLNDSIVLSKNEDVLTSAEVQLLLDNVVYPEDIEKCSKYFIFILNHFQTTLLPVDDTISTNKLEAGHYSEEQIIKNIIHDQFESSEPSSEDEIRRKLSRKFTSCDFAKHMPTFWRLKRKLENVKELYPELYYRDQNIFEMYANSETENDAVVSWEEGSSDGFTLKALL